MRVWKDNCAWNETLLTYIYWSSICPTHNAWFKCTGFRKWGYHIKWALVTNPNRTKQFEFGLGFEFRSTRLLQSLKALVIKLVQDHVRIFSLHSTHRSTNMKSALKLSRLSEHYLCCSNHVTLGPLTLDDSIQACYEETITKERNKMAQKWCCTTF